MTTVVGTLGVSGFFGDGGADLRGCSRSPEESVLTAAATSTVAGVCQEGQARGLGSKGS